MQEKIVQPPQKIRKLHTTLNIPPTTTCKEFSAISGVALPPDGVGIQLFFNVEGGKQVTFAGPKGKELQTTIGGGIGNKAYQGTLLAKFQQELKEETAGVLEISQSDNSPTGYILQVRIKDQHGQEVVNIYPATFRDNLTHSVGKIETTETGLKGFHYATFTAFCDGLTEKQLVHIADYMTPTMQFCNNVFAKLTNLPFMNGYLKKFKGKSVEEAQALWNSEAEIAIRAQLAEEFAMQYHSLQEKGQILLQPQQLLQYTEGGRTVSYQNFEQGLKDLFVNAPSPAVLNDGFLKQIGKCSERPFYEVFATDELMDKAKLSQAQKEAADAQAKKDKNDPRAEAPAGAGIVELLSVTGKKHQYAFMSAHAYCATYGALLSEVPAKTEGKGSKCDDSSSIKALIQQRLPASAVSTSPAALPESPRLNK